ncbi:MAG: hypothetical protein B6D53_00335 [Candidatus Omnitrophica bacterium 4484_49]|nr:MAG: hypothetical protein B6D53_00335 [Candidatus Omnitrophica bacterium 4484_49]
MKRIKFIDFRREYNFLKDKIHPAIDKIITRGNFILGEEVQKFESAFSHFCNTRYAVGVNSGTDALFLALRASGIEKGDEVIVPAFTYAATVLAVVYTGAKPVFCDVDLETYSLSPQDVITKITSRTKAIIPVHLYGHPAPMPELLRIARDRKLTVIEDCAQAHGARWRNSNGKWQVVGSGGDLGCFSFYPTKNLGCYGDGGIVVTDNKKLYRSLLMLRDYGRRSKYQHTIIGYNSRLDTVQAGILGVKLKYLNSWNKRRRELATIYNSYLKDIPEVVIPREQKGYYHVYHLYPLRVKYKRDELYNYLNTRGIQCLIHYPIPCHLQPAFKYLGYKRGDLPNSEKLAREVLSLPLYPFITKDEIEYICLTVKRFFRH